MWGYSCGDVVQGSTATCAKLNPASIGWSPVVITVPTGQDLQINLTNNLSFAGNDIPTSLVIVGQLGGGLGTYPPPSSRVPITKARGRLGLLLMRRCYQQSATAGIARAVVLDRGGRGQAAVAYVDGAETRYLFD